MTEKDFNSIVNREKNSCNRATISMWRCAINERMPPSHSCRDFGIDSMKNVLAIKWMIDNQKITPQQLDQARCDSKKLNSLISINENPNKTVFTTIWDIV